MIIVIPTEDAYWRNEYSESFLQSLLEMSKPAKDIKKDILAGEKILFLHLLKLFYFRDNNRDFAGWVITCTGIVTDLKKVKKAKGKDKPFSSQEIFNIFWDERSKKFSTDHKKCIIEFNNKANPSYKYLPSVKANEEKARLFIKDFYKWLSDNFARINKDIKATDAGNVIKMLWKKYKV